MQQEAKDNKIDLPADDPDIVKLLVQFFYEAEYDPVGFAAPPPKQGLKYVAPQSEPHSCSGRNHVHKSCDQRDVCIHHICSNNCSMNCKDFWCQSCLDQPIGTAEQLLTHVKVYAIADKYNVDALKDMAAWKFQRMYALVIWDFRFDIRIADNNRRLFQVVERHQLHCRGSTRLCHRPGERPWTW